MLKNKQHWEAVFPEFIKSGEAAATRLMESAVLAEIKAGQQVFAIGGKV